MKYPGDSIQIVSGWEALLNRPNMYIGKKSIFGLRCLLMGMDLTNMGGLAAGGGDRPNKFFEMDSDSWFEFEKWVKIKTKKFKGLYRSFDIALQETGDNDEKAFDLWVEWFKEFKAKE